MARCAGNFNGIGIHEFYRVLDGDDVFVILLADPINDRHQRGGLARTGRAHHQSKTLFLGDLLTDRLDDIGRKPNFVERSDSVRDQSNGDPDPLMGKMGLQCGTGRCPACRPLLCLQQAKSSLPFSDQALQKVDRLVSSESKPSKMVR